MQVPDECVRRHRDSESSIKEQQSEVILLNPAGLEISEIQVDGCVFNATDDKRCDWLVNVNNISLFIELKGSDMEGAYHQLAQTQHNLADIVRRHIFWIISYSGSPRFNTKVQKLKITAKRDYRAILRVERSPYSHKL